MRVRGAVQSLGALIRRDASVHVIATAATAIVRLASSILLTRLLTPDVFGLVGIITTVVLFLTLVTDLGFQPFVVRHPSGDDPHFLDVIWSIQVGRGVALFLAAAGSAGLVAWLLRKPELHFPLAVASGTLLLQGAASMALVRLVRLRRVLLASALDFFLVIIQTVSALLLALVLRNVWAIVLAMLIQSLVRAVLSYLLFDDSRRKPAWDSQIWSEFRPFSWTIMKSSALFLLITQLDKVILARFLSLPDFGLYIIAANLASLPGMFAYSYGSRILYPRYAQSMLTDSRSASLVYYGHRRRVSLCYSFSVGALVTSAPALIGLLYDPRYAEAARYLSILAVSGTLLLSNIAANEYLTASGRVVSGLRANQLRVAWIACAGALGYLLLGTLGVVLAIGFMEVVPLIYFWRALRWQGVLDWRQEANQLSASLLGLAAGAVISIGYFAVSTLLLQR